MTGFNSRTEYITYRDSDDNDLDGAVFNYTLDGIERLLEVGEKTTNCDSFEEFGAHPHLSQTGDKYEVHKSFAFTNVIFKNFIFFKNTTFNYEFLWSYCNFESNVSFENIVFKKEFDIEGSNFTGKNRQLRFTNCTFEGTANFTKLESHIRILIEDCTFNEEVKFSECTFLNDIKFIDCTFCNGVDFSNSKFNRKLYFLYNQVSKDMQFNNCEFSSTAKIVDTKGDYEKVDFSLSTIKGMLFFNGWGGKLNFKETTCVEFAHIFIEPGGYVIIRNVNSDTKLNGGFNFDCANILGTVVMSDVYANRIDLENAAIVGSFCIEKSRFVDYSNSQTYRKLKNESLKCNDSISALKYKAEEMKKYKFELDSQKSKNNRKDRVLLKLNTISNDNGQNWVRGIWFTVVCWLGFYLAFLVISRVDLIMTFFQGNEVQWTFYSDLSNLLNYLWSIDFLSTLIDWVDSRVFNLYQLPLIILSSLVFILGKIAIGYGIYQTISAFRKYGR